MQVVSALVATVITVEAGAISDCQVRDSALISFTGDSAITGLRCSFRATGLVCGGVTFAL